MGRPLKISLGLAGFSLLAFLTFVGTWPLWLGGTAQDKAHSALARRFETVEIGAFELTKTTATIRDLTLTNPDFRATFRTLTVTFEPHLWDQRVTVQSVEVNEGSLSATVEALQALRPKGSTGSAAKPSRIDLGPTTVDVKDIVVSLREKTYEGSTIVYLRLSPIRGPYEIELHDSTAKQGEDVLASVEIVRTTLDREKPFPLTATITNAGAGPVSQVDGNVTVFDPKAHVLDVELRGAADAGQPWSFEGSIDRVNDVAFGSLSAKNIRTDQLPVKDLPLESGTLSIELDFSRKGSKLTANGTADVKDLVVFHRRLSKYPVPVSAHSDVHVDLDLETRELLLRRVSVQPSGVPFTVAMMGRVLWTPEPKQREFELTLSMDEAKCQDVLASIPTALVPGLRGFELTGTTSLEMETVVKMHDPKATVLKGGLDVKGCRIKSAPQAVNRLMGPFIHTVRMKSGHVAQVPLLHGHAQFASWDRIPRSLPGAVLSTEDGSFFRHKGYRASAFKESLERNIELGTIRRGGSTLTMQAVKNLLLSHERTVSRKLQEIFLAWAVEQLFTKERILELYLNVVEFGPGIYGVSHAADHYFGKSIEQVNSREAAFLATLLPRPVERHGMWCRGRMTPKHASYVDKIHYRMLSFKRISREEYEASRSLPFTFTRNGFTTLEECLAKGQRMKSGTFTQTALSGLLGEG